MSRVIIVFVFALSIVLISTVASCDWKERSRSYNGLTQTYCGSCHLVPDPSSLTKSIWKDNVMVKMSDYFKWQEVSKFRYANKRVMENTGTIPMTDTIWTALEHYFVSGGLDEAVELNYNSLPVQDYFQVKQVQDICENRGVSAVAINERSNQFVSSCNSRLLTFDTTGTFLKINNTGGLISGIFPTDSSSSYILDPGILDPHEGEEGSLKLLNTVTDEISTIQKDLRRPVYLSKKNNGLFISEFGNENGRLSHLDLESKEYSTVSNLPGAYKSFILDYDKDGKDEVIVLFAQAMEGVYVRGLEDRNKNFVPLLSFGPEWGISDMDTLDVNKDGYTDLVIVNGDNADFSIMPKAYHGVRVYLNNKKGGYEETFSFPIHGASQVQCLDANGDGLEDILIGSFFAINKTDGLILLINNGSAETIDYVPYRFLKSDLGQWMVMNKGDVDGDGDLDVVIGSFEIARQTNQNKKGEDDQTDLLLLLNKSK